MTEFLLVALLVELTPGPNMGYLAALTLSRGWRAGAFAVFGVALGLLVMGLAAALGLAALVAETPAAMTTLRYLGAAYFLYLAVDAWGPPVDRPGEGHGEWSSFSRALVTNLLNPKAALFFVTVIPEFAGPVTAAEIAGYALAYVLVATLVHSSIVVFAGSVRSIFSGGRSQTIVRRGAALLMGGVAIWFFLRTSEA